MNADEPKKIVSDPAPEPVAERLAVPIWMLMLLGIMIFGGGLFMAAHAGDFHEEVYLPYYSSQDVYDHNPQDPAAKQRAEGLKVFSTTCAACHQLTGLGKEGSFPPLAGSEWVQASSGDRIVRAVLNGLSGPITVAGKDFNGAMPPWRDNFSDQQIAAVLSYVRSSWGNKGAPVPVELVTAARAEKHPSPMTADELQKIPLH